jgi:hypothetical protein
MASLRSILRNVRAEVEGRIIDITPNAHKETRFTNRPVDERDDKPIFEVIGLNRLAELSLTPATLEYTWIGSATRGMRIILPLVIVYEDTDTWNANSVDDMDLIYKDLNSNLSTVTGVHIREIQHDTPATFERNPDDPWLYAILPLRLICEAT